LRIGTRLTGVLLLCVVPVLAFFTYRNVARSTTAYDEDLRRNSRTITLGLARSFENDISVSEWDQVRSVFVHLQENGADAALFDRNAALWFALPDFPQDLLHAAQKEIRLSKGDPEFSLHAAKREWFCRLVNLRNADQQAIGYLLVARDWTGMSEDLRSRMIGSMVSAAALVLVIIAIIPLAVRRYVSRPLADLSEKVVRFSREDEPQRGTGGDELQFLTEEFRRLDERLTKARFDLVERHQQQLELERRLQHADRLATIGTLASGLAHEIGTPMSVIRGRAEYLLQKQPKPDKTAEGLQIIIEQIDRISRIVRLLLDYARPRESLRINCDVRPIVGHVLGLVETEATRRNIRLLIELGARPLNADCDPGQLEQVFVNLAMNALDAMSQSGGTLRVVATADGNGRPPRLRLAFQDTGPGIPNELRAQIFLPFFTTKEPGKGTGMGLAVSRSIMRDHGGEITFDSHPGGTSFQVVMPMTPPRTDTARTSSRK
jgi:two-component system, NtrC family, sensor kinase